MYRDGLSYKCLFTSFRFFFRTCHDMYRTIQICICRKSLISDFFQTHICMSRYVSDHTDMYISKIPYLRFFPDAYLYGTIYIGQCPLCIVTWQLHVLSTYHMSAQIDFDIRKTSHVSCHIDSCQAMSLRTTFACCSYFFWFVMSHVCTLVHLQMCGHEATFTFFSPLLSILFRLRCVSSSLPPPAPWRLGSREHAKGSRGDAVLLLGPSEKPNNAGGHRGLK